MGQQATVVIIIPFICEDYERVEQISEEWEDLDEDYKGMYISRYPYDTREDYTLCYRVADWNSGVTLDHLREKMNLCENFSRYFANRFNIESKELSISTIYD